MARNGKRKADKIRARERINWSDTVMEVSISIVYSLSWQRNEKNEFFLVL